MFLRLFQAVPVIVLLALAGLAQAAGPGTGGVSFPAAAPDLSAGGIATVHGRLAKPAGPGPFPAVVLLHSCGGVGEAVGEQWPGFLVGLGYVALTVDSFGSRGLGRCPNGFMPPTPGSGVRPFPALGSDAYGALDYLAGQRFVDRDRIAVAGYSLGGMTIHFTILPLQARTKRKNGFRAAISLYGPCATLRGGIALPKLARSPIPLLEIIGEKDERTLRVCRERLPKDSSTTLHVLPGVYHAFDVDRFRMLRYDLAGNPMLYSASATRAARDLVRDFLARHLGG